MVTIPEIWPTYQIYGQSTRNMVNIPEIWSTYQKYGQHTRNIVNIPQMKKEKVKYLDKNIRRLLESERRKGGKGKEKEGMKSNSKGGTHKVRQ